MNQVTTHILDTARGVPAEGICARLCYQRGDQWHSLGEGYSNALGRIEDLCEQKAALLAGTYRLHFETADYFRQQQNDVFYPWVDVVFNLHGDGQHYHIPLLLSPFSYSTYRGS
ncbi:MAG: hydroxyisourate hydrolase [Spongiibacteraceae bacterium]|nr:hydroxyisourate hydrolase [Spongiibacteraceae bacterium]